ncbi:hypothetical protein SAMN05216312_11152 [Cohnella sp. OV330]|uniref:hypothetical protein n=1 Tax=Cohnella sp. OV330 TaxID=1855288 RepID=UPI0008DEDDBF|nr:hypothetical protein [Cohnella sp. OV330]SFB51541.1 hypothetical protein SAMN05216312_11152 [Cohnella sp. OV330]
MFSPFLKKKNGAEQQSSREEIGLRKDAQETQAEGTASAAGTEESEVAPDAVLVPKSHMDKKSLDLIFAVEQMIKEKQHVEMSHRDLQDRLGHANGQTDRLNRDLRNLGKVIEEREKSIQELEQRLVDKNLKVDQMMEDYRELQAALTGEIEELKGMIELERQNYAGLLQKYNGTSAEKNKKIGELEEKNERLESELAQMKQKFDALRQEKTHLLTIVNDFTSRLSSPFASNAGQPDGVSAD